MPLALFGKKTADHADAGYRPPRPVAVAHLRSRPAAAAALWSHKKMGNTFWQRQSGCGSSSPLGESDALPCLRGLCSFPHLSKAYNTFILNLSETLNANSFSRLSRSFRGGKSPVLRTFARHSVVLMTRASSRLAQALSHYRKSYRLAHASRLKPLSSCLAAIAQSKNTEKLGKTLKQ